MVEHIHPQEGTNITDLAEFARDKGIRRGSRTFVVPDNPADWLRNPLVNATPKTLRHLFAPRTSKSSSMRIILPANDPIA